MTSKQGHSIIFYIYVFNIKIWITRTYQILRNFWVAKSTFLFFHLLIIETSPIRSLEYKNRIQFKKKISVIFFSFPSEWFPRMREEHNLHFGGNKWFYIKHKRKNFLCNAGEGTRVGFFLLPIDFLFKKDCDIISSSVEWKIVTYNSFL